MLAGMTTVPELRAPFPWFGGKRRAASIVWPRFGDVPNYIEPFFGSGAVLLARPHTPRIETVNDLDGYLANFWRAVAADPEQVARFADWPVNEMDLHARHRWLVEQADFRARMKADPEFYDAKIAGWWVWGLCAWIGSGWCDGRLEQKRPEMGAGADGDRSRWGKGVHSKDMQGPSEKLPLLGGTKGTGVHRRGRASTEVGEQLPDFGAADGAAWGRGVHQKEMREPAGKLPAFGTGGSDGAHPSRGRGINLEVQRSRILDTFELLSRRLRGVRVACGDFRRILTDSVSWRHGVTAVFLDPPYGTEAGRAGKLYAEDSLSVAGLARAWALEHGDDTRLRIALCGYEGEHEMPDTWECVAWKAQGGYGGQRADKSNDNSAKERIWFSPGCLKPETMQRTLFAL